MESLTASSDLFSGQYGSAIAEDVNKNLNYNPINVPLT